MLDLPHCMLCMGSLDFPICHRWQLKSRMSFMSPTMDWHFFFFLNTGEYVDLPSVFSWQLEVSQWKKKKNSVFSFIIIHCKPPLKGTKDYFLRLITADKF